MPKTHYKVDMGAVREATRRDPEREQEEAAHHGFYQYLKYSLVPLDKIEQRDVWHPGRIESIRKAIALGKPLPPIRADLDRGKYRITDGIHRYNASKEAGFTHIPVLEYVTVDAPEMYVSPDREKPVQRPGTWVRLLDPPAYLGSPWAVVVDHLGHASDRGTKRHKYELLGIEGQEAEVIGDWRDDTFEVGGNPPSPVRKLIEDYQQTYLKVAKGASMGPSITTILAATRVADRWLREAAIFEAPPKMLKEATDIILRLWAEGLLRFVEDQERKLTRKASFVDGVIRRLKDSGQDSRRDLQDATKDPTWWMEYEAPTNAPDFFRGSEDNFEWQTLFVRAATEAEKDARGLTSKDPHFFVVHDHDGRYKWGDDIPEREYGYPWPESDVRHEIAKFVEDGLEWAEMSKSILDDYTRTAVELNALAKKHGGVKALQGTKTWQMGDVAVDFSGWKYLAGRIDSKDAEAKVKGVLPPRQSIGALMEYGPNPADRAAQWSPREWILTVWSKPYSLSSYSMNAVPRDLVGSVRHEMQHFAQDALKVIFDLPEIAGLPPKSVRTPGHSTWGEPPGQSGQYAPHELRDIEFQTRLADAVDEFMNDLDNVPVEHWQDFIRKFTATADTPAPRDAHGMSIIGWYMNAWFETMKREDRQRWQAALGKFIDELDQRGVMAQIKRTNQWAPVVVPRHAAWGISVMQYRTRRMGDLMPSRPRGVDWNEWREKSKQLEAQHWPTIKREYEQFIDSLSEEQLVRHKQLVNKDGDLEYWVTPRLQRWDGAGELPRSTKVDHPRVPKRHRY